MGRPTSDPVHYIVSFRVNDDEKQIIEQSARQRGLSVSSYVRKLLNLKNSRKAVTENY